MNYVVTRNEVTCTFTKINHIQLYVEEVLKCRIESGAKHRLCTGSQNTGERNDVHWCDLTVSSSSVLPCPPCCVDS